MKHVDWNGFSAWDMIMPLFLFIVGTAMPFSFSNRFAQGSSLAGMYRKIIIRVLILWVLGMVAQGSLLKFDIEKLKLFSNTLQSIAVGYLVASIALLHLPVLGQYLLAAGLLVGYWALMAFVAVPGQAPGLLEPDMNLARYVDEWVLGRFKNTNTYTWVLSSMGFAATVLLGVMGGHILRMRKSGWLRFLLLLLAGGVCLALGWIWGHGLSLGQEAAEKSVWIFPINKHVWTSSMALWSGGWSFLLLAAFYLVIDVLKLRAWAFPFIVLGANALLVYMVAHVWSMKQIAEPLVGGLAKYIDKWGQYFLSYPSVAAWGVSLDKCGAVLVSFTALAILWIILWYMYRNKTFIRA
jgi:predicted acyltransferase